MFKKFASEALGLSDIGKIVPPADYDKVDADDYIFHEDGEKIFFLIKSKKDEYCFTDRALLHVDGDSAVSSKRTLRRYEYYKHPLSEVALETAGTVDLDVEIKFTIGSTKFSIDVDKRQIKQLADLYKALYAISLIATSNKNAYNMRIESLDKSLEVVSAARSEGLNKRDELEKVNEYVYNWLKQTKETYIKKDFSDVYKKYIEN